MENLLIFLVWIIFVVVSQMLKRKKNDPYEEEQSYPQEEQGKTIEDLLREVEEERRRRGVITTSEKESYEVKEDYSYKGERTMASTKEEETQPSTSKRTSYQTNSVPSTASYKEPDQAILEEQARWRVALGRIGVKKLDLSTPVSTPSKAKATKAHRPKVRFSPIAVEKGIVWAEILQEPRSRRPLTHIMKGRK